MSSGGYDGLHPSSSYGHGDSWRPSGSSGYSYDSSNFYATRRHTPSPSRRYVPHNGYYPTENSYRPGPNSYRPDEDAAYYSRSPSPDPYARAYPRPLERPLEPDAWERPSPWSGVPTASWDDHAVGPASPTSSTSKARGGGMPATRTFEPSDAWKQNHFDRPLSMDTMRRLSMDWYIGDPPVPRTPNPYITPGALGTTSPYGTSSAHPMGDRYRPAQPHREPNGFVPRVSDSYRPGWSPDGKPDARKSSGPYTRGRRVSSTGSKIGSSSPRRSSSYREGRTLERRSRSRSRRSSSRGRRSYSRSSSHSLSRGRRSSSRSLRSRSRRRRSVSRGRCSVSRDRRSANLGNSSSSPGKPAPPVKYSWDRPSKVSGVTSSSKSGAAAQSLQKSSWTRSASRSSIASTRASEKAPSPPPKPQPVSPSQSKTQNATTTQNIECDSKQQANVNDVVNAPLAPTVISAVISQVNVIMDDETTKTIRCPPAPDLPRPDAVLPDPSKAAPETTTAVPLPSPPQPKSTPVLVHLPTSVNGTAKSTASNTGAESVGPKTEDHFEVVVPPPSLHDTPSGYPALADAYSALAPVENNVEPVVDIPLQVDSGPHSSQQIATSPPTPLTIPQLRLLPRSPPSPPVPENIPTEAKSTREALRIVVMTRLLCDRQTREERVNPVILSNLSLAAQVHQERPSATLEEVIKEVVEGPRRENMMENFARMKPSLMERFKERQTLLAEKVRRLREEYLSLHERWVAHCAALDAQSQAAAPAAEIVQPSGRTTRRSMANLGDAVRSDLEMEQIIASLGNDDATDPNHLSLRNLANVPDMISVTKGKVDYLFNDTNQLVENPNEYYGPYTGIHDWTDQEKEIFLDKFAAHPKQFGMIAEHLPNKTAAQCVDYYYLHKKKFIDFRKVISQYAPNKRKRRGTGKKRGNGLLADIRQHDAEVHGELGSPKTVGRPRGRKAMPPPEPKKSAASRRRNQLDLTPSVGSATPTPEPESRRRGRRSTAAPSSRTVSVSLDDGEEEVPEEEPERPAKRAKRTRKVKSAAIVVEEPSTPEPKPPEQTESVSRRKSGSSSAQWSEEDKSLFLTLLGQYGDDFKRIAASMPNKTTIQVSNYYKANLDELDLAKVAAGAPKRSPTPEAQGSRTEAPLPVSEVTTSVRGTTPDPMSSLVPDPPHMSMNGTRSPIHQEASRPDLDPKHLPTWSSTLSVRNRNDPFASSSSSRAPSPSQVRGYPYPVPNGRATAPYPPHTMPSTYSTHPPVPYTYAPYSGPRYPQYDATIPPHPHPLARIPHPYSVADPLSAPGHRMSPGILPMRGRESPYPVMQPPGHPSYHYSLESS